MNPTAVFATIFFVAVSLSSAYQVVQEEDGQEYYLVPVHSRERRQTTWNVESANPGIRATVGHQGTILNNNGHRLDAGAFASKQFHPKGPTTIGGNLGYSHTPSGSNLNIGAQRTPGYGTDVGANGVGSLWRQGNSRLDAVGSYGRHFGGPGGSGRPNYYGGLQFNHRF